MMLETAYKADRLDDAIDKAKELGELILMEKDEQGKIIGIIEIKHYNPKDWGEKTVNDSENEDLKRSTRRH